MTTAEKLKRIKRERGTTNKALAEHFDITEKEIQFLINGKRKPSFRHMLLLHGKEPDVFSVHEMLEERVNG